MRTLLVACVLVVWSLCSSAASATGLEADEINAITDDILANSPFASEQIIYRWRYRGDLSLEDDEEDEEASFTWNEVHTRADETKKKPKPEFDD